MLGKILEQRKEWRRFMRFVVVGLSGTLLDFMILTALKQFWGVPTLPANFFSYSCGIISNFMLSRWLIYPEARQGQTTSQFLRFLVVSLIGLALNNLLVLGLEGPLAQLFKNSAYAYLPAKLIATLLVTFWNFFANRYWTFNSALAAQQTFPS